MITRNALDVYGTSHGAEAQGGVSVSKTLFSELRDVFSEGEPHTAMKNLQITQNGAELWRNMVIRYEIEGRHVQDAYYDKLANDAGPRTATGIYELLGKNREVEAGICEVSRTKT